MRLFAGVELDPQTRAAAADVTERVRRRVGEVAPTFAARWIPAENLHITVWFFGEVDDAGAGALRSALAAPLSVPAFRLRLGGCGAFPPSGAPRVLWIGAHSGAEQMVAAYDAFTARVAPLGFRPERRTYSPHLTIARVKDPGRDGRLVRQALIGVPADVGETTVTSVTLFRSRLSGRGATYEPLLRVPLS